MHSSLEFNSHIHYLFIQILPCNSIFSWLLLRKRWASGSVPSGCCNIISMSCCTSALLLRNQWASVSVLGGSFCNEDMSISILPSSSLSCCTSALLLRNRRASGSVSVSDYSGLGGGTDACIVTGFMKPVTSIALHSSNAAVGGCQCAFNAPTNLKLPLANPKNTSLW